MKSLLSLSTAILISFAPGVSAETLNAAQQGAKEQIASHLGVNPDDYTLTELTRLNCLVESASSDAEKRRLLEAPLSREPVSASVTTQGQQQIAASLGVDASDYTAAELALLKNLMEDESCNVSDPASYAHTGERITVESARIKVQLAAGLGVDPSDYTVQELMEMHFGDDDD